MNTESAERDRRRMTSLRPVAGLFLATPLVLVGCSHAPEYSIFGSFFPVWIFCSVGGLLLATGASADRSDGYRRPPGSTCAVVSQYGDLSRLRVVADVLQLGKRDAEQRQWSARARQSRSKT
jgi:hypothetical protein